MDEVITQVEVVIQVQDAPIGARAVEEVENKGQANQQPQLNAFEDK